MSLAFSSAYTPAFRFENPYHHLPNAVVLLNFPPQKNILGIQDLWNFEWLYAKVQPAAASHTYTRCPDPRSWHLQHWM